MVSRVIAVFGLAAAASATTLERLPLPRLTDQSTDIVRAKVATCASAFRRSVIYTTCDIVVSERWKGTGSAQMRVSTLGGQVGASRQTYAGAPVLVKGEEHIFFLWRGPSGMIQVMGLSQGLFSLAKTASGEVLAVRTPARERLVDAASGRAVWDEGVEMPLDQLRATVRGRVSQ